MYSIQDILSQPLTEDMLIDAGYLDNSPQSIYSAMGVPESYGPQLPDIRAVSGKIQEVLGAKEPNQAGMIGEILTKRFQPDTTWDDVAKGAVSTLYAGKPVSGQDVANERLASHLDRMNALAKYEYYNSRASGGPDTGATGALVQQYMAATGADFPTALAMVKGAGGLAGRGMMPGADGVTPMQGYQNIIQQNAYSQSTGSNQAELEYAGPIAAEKDKGTFIGQAQTKLPVIEQNTAYAQNLLKQLVAHPGLSSDTGAMSYLPVMRGTDRANFRSIRNQINGTAFLQAFQTLKGGGQISNAEGDKATTAITRMNDPNIDSQSFKSAANELFNILQVGLERARGEAQGNFNQNFTPEQFNKQNFGPMEGAQQASDGNYYIPDPERPGKYLMVQP